MSFSTDMAKLISDQLTRLATLNRHQLAGQVANIDFWIGEVRHALEVIDGYARRFQKLKANQARHAAEHQTREFALDDPCCTEQGARPPRRVPDQQLRAARRVLCEAARRFLIRCYQEDLIDKERLRDASSGIDVPIDAADLRGR